MLIYDVKAYRYYSDFAGFDFVVVLESDCSFDVVNFLDDVIMFWHDYPEEVGDINLTDYVVEEFKRKNIIVSIYHSNDED